MTLVYRELGQTRSQRRTHTILKVTDIDKLHARTFVNVIIAGMLYIASTSFMYTDSQQYVTGYEKRDHIAQNAIFAVFQTATISRP